MLNAGFSFKVKCVSHTEEVTELAFAVETRRVQRQKKRVEVLRSEKLFTAVVLTRLQLASSKVK